MSSGGRGGFASRRREPNLTELRPSRPSLKLTEPRPSLKPVVVPTALPRRSPARKRPPHAKASDDDGRHQQAKMSVVGVGVALADPAKRRALLDSLLALPTTPTPLSVTTLTPLSVTAPTPLSATTLRLTPPPPTLAHQYFSAYTTLTPKNLTRHPNGT